MAINIGDRVPGSKWIVTGILGEGAMGHVLEVLRTTTNMQFRFWQTPPCGFTPRGLPYFFDPTFPSVPDATS